MPFYRGERITFDVAPSRLDFTVEHDSLRIEVKPPSALCRCLGSQPRAQMLQTMSAATPVQSGCQRKWDHMP